MDPTPLIGERQEPSKARMCLAVTGKVVGGFLLVVFLLAVVVQAILYKWATLQCNAGSLSGYDFPGGGAEELVLDNTLLIEQEPKWWASSFIVVPANEDGLPKGASLGVYFRTWGPIFYTYTYQDILGKETFVIRDRPLSIGGSHQIMRCDGNGPTYIYSEGGHFLMNRIRSAFGMYTTREYDIFEDGKLVAVSQKLGGDSQSHKQMILRYTDETNPFASTILQDRHFHGQFDEWFVHITDKKMPNYVPNGISALMAFATASVKQVEAAKAAKGSKLLAVNATGSFLATQVALRRDTWDDALSAAAPAAAVVPAEAAAAAEAAPAAAAAESEAETPAAKEAPLAAQEKETPLAV